ncbi:DUF309 domain-containing protein [Deinococcus aquiradiocola]|uniref:DUF309 domain-containing protein n=1 Tax=Deinococcus aquiradiocola TaxID=393059 RepID=A0A917USN8_9DEIO|nr:DUF309 domain-containing protein [Deinococcus aquiradiocola]GGJ83036.1 hypothetical protein GCM10008939_28650 [Deinococcus aquiradiocola]
MNAGTPDTPPPAPSLPPELPPALHAGAALFTAGEWWEAHEAWEGVWAAATGDERRFVQGLILLAAALHKRWVHGSLTHRNYFKALRHLEGLPPGFGGVDLARLQGDTWAALHADGLRPALYAPGAAQRL